MTNEEEYGEPNVDRDAPQPNLADDAQDLEGEYLLTAKDAGWRSPTLYILPMTLNPVDPPELHANGRPKQELSPTGRRLHLPPMFLPMTTLEPIDPPEPRNKKREKSGETDDELEFGS